MTKLRKLLLGHAKYKITEKPQVRLYLSLISFLYFFILFYSISIHFKSLEWILKVSLSVFFHWIYISHILTLKPFLRSLKTPEDKNSSYFFNRLDIFENSSLKNQTCLRFWPRYIKYFTDQEIFTAIPFKIPKVRFWRHFWMDLSNKVVWLIITIFTWKIHHIT